MTAHTTILNAMYADGQSGNVNAVLRAESLNQCAFVAPIAMEQVA